MIQLFATNISHHCEQEIPHKLLDRVTPARRKKVTGFHHKPGAWSSLVGELLVLKLYTQFTGQSLDAVKFEKNQYGRPYIANNPNFSYNISHSGEWVVCAVSHSQTQLGVDIEKVRPIRSLTQKAIRFFSKNETTHLLAQPAAKQSASFVTIWTRKESYLKACGTGVNRPLSSFTVPHEDQTQQKLTTKSLPGFTFYSWDIDNYRLTACSDLPTFSPNLMILNLEEL